MSNSPDLNMDYYHIGWSPASKILCTMMLPWGKYEYQVLPIGLSNSPDIFEENMPNLFRDLEIARKYIDKLLITSNGSLQDHLDKVKQVLEMLPNTGLEVNANKSKIL